MVILENYFQVSGAYLRGEAEESQPFKKTDNSTSIDQCLSDKDIELMLKLVNKEIIWAERLADTYNLSSKENTDAKSELMKLAVKLIELKEKR